MFKYNFYSISCGLRSDLTSDNHAQHEQAVWVGKPWVAPAAVIRTVTIFIVALIFLIIEDYFRIFSYNLGGLLFWAWTSLIFTVIWVLSMLNLLIFRASNTYVLWQDGLEIRRGIVRLHSFVVTPAGFGDMLVEQSVGGRVFGYGDITVNSQGERQTKLLLVRAPFAVEDKIREIMGKPMVRLDSHV